MDHGCEAIIVTCIDYRLQEHINNWISENFLPKAFDRVAIAGGVKNLEFAVSQVEIAHRLHHINKVLLINHEDCGAYGQEGIPAKHTKDLRAASQKLNMQFPGLEVKTYYLHLNGSFEEIK